MPLSALAPDVRAATQAAAIPHWFDALFIERAVRLANEQIEAELLRRVGGGYIFIHRSLLEYFASLEEW